MADFDLSMAITADGDQAVGDLDAVAGAQTKVIKGQQDLETQSKKTGQSAAEMARQQRATADALNAVTRATNPTIGSQRALEAALRKAEKAYIDGKISATAYAKAQEIASRASFANVNSMKQNAQGVRQLGLQFNDLGTQIAAGISPMTAFIQQTGQIGYAMSQMGGTARTVGNFLAGGWGALILVGASVLGNFISKLLDAKKATDDLSEAAKLHAMTSQELTKALEDENKALGKNIQTEEQARQAALDSAEAKRQEVIQRRNHIQAILEEQKALLAAQNTQQGQVGPRGELATLGATETQRQIQGLEAQLAENQRQLALAMQNVRLAQIPIARAGAEAKIDKSKAEDQRHSKALADLDDSYKHARISQDAYRTALDAETAEHRKQTDAIKDANRKPHEVSLGDQVSATLGRNILAAAQSHQGQTGQSPSLQQFLGGQHIDPEKAAWCAAFINAVLASQGVAGSGSNSARDFLKFGSATNTPEKGDIVVVRSPQAPSGAHVGFFAGQQDGRVLVTGGNQGRGHAVTTTSFAQSQVLGFRRPPTAAESLADEDKLAQKAEKDAEQLAQLGERAAQTIANLSNRAMNTGAVQQANAQLALLDKTMEEVEKRKPPNLEELRKNAAEARKDIQDGILKPFNDFLEASRQSLEVGKLRAAGLNVEADTLQEVYRLEQSIGRELLPDEIKKIYEANQARKEGTEELKRSQEAQRKYLQDLGQYKDVFRSLFSGNAKDVTSFPKRFFDVVKQQVGDNLFEQIFGGIFKQLEDDKTGVNKVKASNVKLAQSADKATNAILGLANAASITAADPLAPLPDGQAVTPDGIAKGIESSPLGGLLTKLGKGIGLSDKTLQTLSGLVSQGLQGAATGQVVNSFLQPIGKLLGFKTSNTGAAIGGGLGQIAGTAIGGPVGGAIGSVLGSIAGSIIGGLFKKSKKASSTVSGSGGDINVGSAVGHGSSQLQAANTLGGAVGDAIRQIAETLGGTLGSFAVSIGVDKKGRFAVDPSGQGRTKNVQTFADEQAAVAAAIMDAVRDGAVKGLSAAVQQALSSSPDINKALQEALKVRDLETLIKGITGQIDQAFQDFETVAEDRVRLAKKYGLDLVKVEEINAKQRADLLDQVLKQRVGDLQQFLDDLKFGDLFEGTASQKRDALLAQISKVRDQADQGIDGAASQLADLERQLVGFSRETFGTAGPEFAADRTAAQADAERIIAEETQRVRDAQERSTAQLNAATTQNQLTNETNDLLTQANGYLAVLAGAGGVGGSGLGVGSGGIWFNAKERATALV